MLPFADPSSDPNHKKPIRLTDAQTDRMMDIYRHFTEAIRPAEMQELPAGSIDDPMIDYTTKFLKWTRRKPRYHPIFKVKVEEQKDVDYLGFDFRPHAKADPAQLQKASQFVWHNREAVPQPALLKAWMADSIDIDGKPKTGVELDIPSSIFNGFADWDRFHQYVLDQMRAGVDNLLLAENLITQHKSGAWTLPSVLIGNCERLLATAEVNPDLREVLARDYIDLTLSPEQETRPEINLKRSVTRKKISRRQLAQLEDIVIYLLPSSLRVGLTRKVTDRQRHYLARAAKWLRPQSDPVWNKPWSDGLDLLALMVMDRDHPLNLDFVRQASEYIHRHIDDKPEHNILLEKTVGHAPAPLLMDVKGSSEDESIGQAKNKQLLRRIILNPNIKCFPGSDIPKDLILTRLGILRPDKIIDEERLLHFEEVTDQSYAMRNDPNYWLMNQLDVAAMLAGSVIDHYGNVLADDIEVTPFLRLELRHGAQRQLWNKVAGIWLYPTEEKPLPNILTRHEAETLQIICHWLDKNPRRPRPFFWSIQDMVWAQFQGDPPLVGKRMRELAVYIQEHRNEPPDFETLKRI